MNARASKSPITVLVAAVALLPAVVGITVGDVSTLSHVPGMRTPQSSHKSGFWTPKAFNTPFAGLEVELYTVLKQQPRFSYRNSSAPRQLFVQLVVSLRPTHELRLPNVKFLKQMRGAVGDSDVPTVSAQKHRFRPLVAHRTCKPFA